MAVGGATRVPVEDENSAEGLAFEFRRLARVLAGEPAPAASPRSYMPEPVRRIVELFDLTAFETDVLLLAAGAELDPRLRRAIRADTGGEMPTIGLACTRLAGARWDVMLPSQTLRRWGLIDVAARRPLVESEFVVDECVLAIMTGAPAEDTRLDGWARLRIDTAPKAVLPKAQLERAARALAANRALLIAGGDTARRAAAAAQLSRRMGLDGAVIEASVDLIGRPDPDAPVIRRIARAALIEGAIVAIAVTTPDRAVRELADRFGAVGVPLVVSADDLGDAAFEIVTVGSTRAQTAERERSVLVESLEPEATLDDLVLPAEQLEAIRDFVAFARQRELIAQAWGGARGHGASAMLSGESGTGKTLAAEAVASALGMTLHVVDLGHVVSKWVGETPKNVSSLFEQCADGVLLFDEADALFGRRGNVRDGTDRYANLEVSHLLTRMERHRGVTILTTNLAPSIDTAFHRRLDAIVEFPLPDAAARATLWERAFPSAIEIGDLDLGRLTEIPITGAIIRAIARRAAALAADRDVPVDTAIVLESARKEYRKLGRRPRGRELVMS